MLWPFTRRRRRNAGNSSAEGFPQSSLCLSEGPSIDPAPGLVWFALPLRRNQSTRIRCQGTTIFGGFGKFHGKHQGADPEESREMSAHPIFG